MDELRAAPGKHETAAILLMLLAEEEAAAIVSRLEPQEIERLGSAMFALGDVNENRVTSALDRFVEGAKGQTTMSSEVGGHLSGVVTRALGSARAPAMLERIIPETLVDPLPSLKWLSVNDLLVIARDEHPQFVALLVAHMAPNVAAAVIAQLSEGEQTDILFRAATLGHVSEDAFALADSQLAEWIGTGGQAAPGVLSNVPTIAAVLNHAPRALQQRLMKALMKRDRILGQRIEDELVIFDDILSLADKDLGVVCRSVDPADLALAMKGVTEAQRERIFATMSARAADTMRDAIAEQGPARLAEVLVAQKSIVMIAKTMGENGTIQLGQGTEDFV
ncbi:flagellar motor switch protein FliG [Sphingomonas paeninsulae]|nr:FliG C-terminal domain-containing protein [Sphingomonas paeninsulae]